MRRGRGWGGGWCSSRAETVAVVGTAVVLSVVLVRGERGGDGGGGVGGGAYEAEAAVVGLR